MTPLDPPLGCSSIFDGLLGSYDIQLQETESKLMSAAMIEIQCKKLISLSS